MPREIFLVPMELQGNTYRGKYTNDPAVVASGTIRYSLVDSAVVMIDSTQTYLDSVDAQADATRLATEANIDNTLTNGQVTAAKTLFENNGIPAGFINIGDTRREVIRAVCGLFLFSQRMEGRFGTGFWQRAQELGITLATQFVDFPQAVKDEFIAVRDDHGWGNLGLTNQSTLRQILTAVSQQFESEPITIGGFDI